MQRYRTEWERFARRDPYYAVLTDDRFRGPNLSESSLEEFFATGAAYVDFLGERIDLQLESALDFGCGVGRLTIPLARRCRTVTAVDASPEMLAQTEANCRRFGVTNVRALEVEEFVRDHGSFDLVNAYIVFQHIPAAEGELLYRELLKRVRSGGFAAIHLMYTRPAPLWRRFLGRARSVVPGLHRLANIVQRRPASEPHMQMNAYNLNRFFDALQSLGFGRAFSCFTDHGGYRGILVIAQRADCRIP